MEKIRTLREMRRLSQEKLGELSGLSRSTIINFETGKRNPRLCDLEKIASALKVPVDDLLGDSKSDKIKIELIFGKMDEDEEAIDMTSSGNKFKLFMDSDGTLGIKGGSKFTCLEDIDNFIAEAAAELKAGFDFQVKRGALALAKA